MKPRSMSAYRRPAAQGIQAQLFRWRRLSWLAAAVAAVMVGDVLLTKYGPALRAATVETGASFSVSAGSFASDAKAATFAAVLDSAGLPILVRVRPDDHRYQVLVGPYVSTEEAERAQRKLATWGLGEARLVVDDTMRSSPQVASVFGLGGAASTSVVIVAAAGMSSIVFEMSRAPKEVEARRTSPTTLDVEVGRQTVVPGAQAVRLDPLWLPDGVSLVRELSMQDEDSGSLRAHLVVPEGVESRLRLEGRRVYIDIAFPNAPWRVRKPARSKSPGAAGSGPEAATASDEVGRVVSDPPETYREQLAAVVGRFTQIEPFLLSAVEHPEPDVLTALSHSMEGLRDSLEMLKAPADLENNRMSLIAAVARATNALTPAFEGDRVVTVHDAIALFEVSATAEPR